MNISVIKLDYNLNLYFISHLNFNFLRKIIYMYLRVVTIKCPNQTAKKALKLLSKQVATEQMNVGLIKETVVDISETNFLNVKY